MPSRLTLGACVCCLVLAAAACGGRVDAASNRGDGVPGAAGGSAGAGGSSGASGGGPGGAGGTPGQTGPGGGAIAVQRTADKVDLLFDIDNSASMGDKQAYLAQAVPDLITPLIQPNCVTAGGTITGQATLAGDCPAGSSAEFPPVHDLHIGIVSSSLGPRLGDVCPAYDPTNPSSVQKWTGGTLNRHNDDQAHLLNRGADPNNLADYTETPVGDAPDPDDFLDWFPPSSANPANTNKAFTGPTPVTVSATLNTDLQTMVVGVHQFGCGIESQLESWYRFLIQPDPYGSLVKDKTGKFALWSGVDMTILAQRADFLRPDSLVAIVVLSDENDSEVDVRSFGGTAWNFMSSQFPPPRGTSVCATNPADPGCTSCAFAGNNNDSSCMTNGGTYPTSVPTNWGYDLNLRHVHEKQKYGVSVQFPIQRYVLGLTSPKVPNRDGEYPSGATAYQGLVAANQTCTNPLYAASLPKPPSGTAASSWTPTVDELCNMPRGARTPNLVFYAHIGGVPHQLLQTDPTNPDSPQKATLTAADWQLVLGKDPENFDYTGIDPHMVESYQQRTNVPVPANGFRVADQSQPAGTDPISGREWLTDSTNPLHQGLAVDLEYACTFQLAKPRDCSNTATTADPTLLDSCDCTPPDPTTEGAFTHAEVPAVCDDQIPTQQDYAKAYPTVRELELAHLLGQVSGANEGVISSICPIHAVAMTAGDPLYGYRPAMDALVSRMKVAL